ncbi:serine/threonine-protein kinase [Oxynema aestuarii]|uniref:non-specific serine/threonine protein kinase n=1 Tax=Oxynema aestuarii AP17 TaxID=2064643 RepID=A0A6H1U1M3_9CYAN|nr:serine/threonine-protein kinase [Oxynema aestuarii]QIZ72070.1 serine/threonine protein kinase [Oxynema aestuarii AP17]
MTYCLNPSCPQPENPANTQFCIACGTQLRLKERYRAIRAIAAGGMGRTFLGRDEDRLDAPCVIKQFFPQNQSTSAIAKATELFEREARQLYSLGEHPQIPTLYAYLEQDRRLYLVQEWIDGPTLLQELRDRGPWSESEVKALLWDLLPLLQFIHERGVVHRDLKPDNLLRRRGDGKVVLVDFGIAKQGSATAMAQTGTRAGTQGYAPMEQLRGGQAYPASDLYSLGVTAIQLLVGKMPEDLYDPTNGEWVWRSQLAKQGRAVEEAFAAILDKLLRELLRDRYRRATDVLQDLQLLSQKSTRVQAIAPPPPPSPPPSIASRGAVAPSSSDPISAELEEIRTHFSQATGRSSPPSPPSPPSGQKRQGKGDRFDPIQADLEALRSEFGEQE